jgi:hydroxysqualene synthase
VHNAAPVSVEHYENFPVASWLCPPALRAPIVAIYHFARVGDDIADEGDASNPERLATLSAYRNELVRVGCGATPSDTRWLHVFTPLARAIQDFHLPLNLLDDLLQAFERDIPNPQYSTRNELLDYCRQSANPIGRLLLHLHQINTPEALMESDCVCSALQLINFWQDVSVDHPRGRCYLPREDASRHGVTLDPPPLEDTPSSQALLGELCSWAKDLMLEGAPLVHKLPGRAGWELRLVVQGGLRILEKIGHSKFRSLTCRPVISASDAIPLLWRSLRMEPSA